MSVLGFSPDCVTGAEEDIVNHTSPRTFTKCLLMILSQFYVKTSLGGEKESIDDSKDIFIDAVGDDDNVL